MLLYITEFSVIDSFYRYHFGNIDICEKEKIEL